MTEAHRDFTEQELEVLKEGGVDLGSVTDEDRVEAQTRSALAEAKRIQESLTTAQVAGLCGVSDGRVRHWASHGEVISFRLDKELRYPSFQFREGKRMPQLAAIISAAPDFWTHVELSGYLTTPQPGLEVEGRPTAPVDWLFAGRGMDAVVAEMDWGWG